MKKYKTVEEFFADQKSEKLEQVMSIRSLLFKAEPKLVESLKWNAPNYSYQGEDRITFNVANKEDKVMLVIHMGAKRKEDKKGKPVIDDPDNLVQWNSDIRGMIFFDNLDDIHTKSGGLKKLIKRWLLVSTLYSSKA